MMQPIYVRYAYPTTAIVPTVKENKMATDYGVYSKKKVKIRVTADGEESTLEGSVEAGSPVGLVFKQKGKRNSMLFAKDQILEVTQLDSTPDDIRRRSMARVTKEKVRDHLADRHGYKISDVSRMSEDEAEKFHDSIDHTDLGHWHRTPRKLERAIEEAEEELAEEFDED